MTEQPYIEEPVTYIVRRYNPNYGDQRLCECGHSYYRHFDTYEDMLAVGCKYCGCNDFKEFTGTLKEVSEFVQRNYPEQYQDLVKTAQEEGYKQDAWLLSQFVELQHHYKTTNKTGEIE